jgi:hypothetical protein
LERIDMPTLEVMAADLSEKLRAVNSTEAYEITVEYLYDYPIEKLIEALNEKPDLWYYQYEGMLSATGVSPREAIIQVLVVYFRMTLQWPIAVNANIIRFMPNL